MACLALSHPIHFCLKSVPVDNAVEKTIATDMLQGKSFDLIQVSHKVRCSLPHITMKNIYLFGRIALQIILGIIVPYPIAVTMHNFLGKRIAPLDSISLTACRSFWRTCSPGWFLSDSMSSLEILDVSQLAFFSKPSMYCEQCSFFWQSCYSCVKSFLLRTFHIRQKKISYLATIFLPFFVFEYHSQVAKISTFTSHEITNHRSLEHFPLLRTNKSIQKTMPSNRERRVE